MPGNTNTSDSLRRVFYEGFVARDIAEPLASFDDTADIETVRNFMEDRPLFVVGIRCDGIVQGFIEQEQIDGRSLSEQTRPVDQAGIVPTTASLHDVVMSLRSEPFLLVSTLGQPAGVISRDDLEKPPMRMWLFGMITLFELSLTRLIDDHYKEQSWTSLVTESRLQKAEQLRQERMRRNRNVRLIDCLQLGDKGQLLSRNEALRNAYFGRSRRQIEKAIKGIESLRNNLAHSQAFVSENWDVVVRITETLDRILDIPADLVAPSSLNPYNREPDGS